MSQYTFRSSKPDQWVSPRPQLDPFRRAHAYGRIQPLNPPSLIERLLGRS